MIRPLAQIEQPGDKPTAPRARMMNQLIASHNAQAGVDVGRGGSVVGAVFAYFRLTDVSDGDALKGKRVQMNGTGDPIVDTDTVSIARPPHLVQSAWAGETVDGITYTYTDANTRTASDGSASETQIVMPPYSTSDIANEIVAVFMPGGTGVESADGDECFWMEYWPPRNWAQDNRS